MRRRTITPLGALHPILFFAGVYAVALFFSIFICSTLFYSINSTDSVALPEDGKKVEINVSESAAVASLK